MTAGFVGVASTLALTGCASDPADEPASTAATPMVKAYAPGEQVGGKSLTEWFVAWNAWVQAQMGPNYPNTDTTGQYCAVGQDPNSPVFYLTGTFGGPATRTCTVSSSKVIFVPLISAGADNAGVPADKVATEAQLMKAGADLVDSMDPASLVLRVDDVSVPDLPGYKVGPVNEPYNVPPGENVYKYYGIDFSGPVDASYGGGYGVLLPPFTKGTHKVEFGAALKDKSFSVAVKYTLDVQ